MIINTKILSFGVKFYFIILFCIPLSVPWERFVKVLTKPELKLDIHFKNKVIKKVNLDKNIYSKYFIKNTTNQSVVCKINSWHKVLKVLREVSLLMWLGKLLKMIVRECHGAFYRKFILWLGYCRIERFQRTVYGRGFGRRTWLNYVNEAKRSGNSKRLKRNDFNRLKLSVHGSLDDDFLTKQIISFHLT